jgi:hypothetical protein
LEKPSLLSAIEDSSPVLFKSHVIKGLSVVEEIDSLLDKIYL